MIGPTGVGKTEIARRLARLAQAPFVKVEASKFTEVGYVGRDVESMVRDLVEAAISLVREEEMEKVQARAAELAEDRLMELLGGQGPGSRPSGGFGFAPPPPPPAPSRLSEHEREKLRARLRTGSLDDEEVEVETAEGGNTFLRNFSGQGMEEIGFNLQDLFKNMPGMNRTRRRRVPVPEALKLLQQEEAGKLVDSDRVTREALVRAEQSGILFIDEIDKIASREGSKGGGPDVSREGVQRDILPIVEGSTVNTKYGPVKTDHMLFIAAGAFHLSKPSDLIPELQGRFPIRVELEPLTGEDLVRILKEPKNSLIRQYTALLATEGVRLHVTDDAVQELARIAQGVNERTQNIGARRLHTVLERLLDEASFSASEVGPSDLQVDAAYVREKLQAITQDEDLSRYIL
jgi:ATP-dependent HslUV protease ATP-binding subunit HslU